MARPALTVDVNAWVRTETPEHLKLLSRLRARLVDTMHEDITEHGTPSRDWCRAFARYQSGWTTVVTEERERAKLRLLLDKSGMNTLSEDEYETELRELAIESLGALPVDELHRELERRASLAAVAEDLTDEEE